MQRGGWEATGLLAAQGALVASRRRVSSVGVAAVQSARRRARGVLAAIPGKTLAVLVCGTAAGQVCLLEAQAAEDESKAATADQQAKTQLDRLARLTIEGMVAGAAAGSAVEAALYPIDTIKTRLQVARSGGGINFSGLYSGVWGNLVGVIPASAVFIGVYEPLKAKLLQMVPEHLSVTAHLTAGAAGGFAASFVRVPTEVIKQRMQTGQFTSAVSAIRSIVTQEGVRGLYAGYGSFLLRDLPFDAIQFAIYEQLKVGLAKVVKRPLHDGELAIVGAAAGALTGAVTTPLDVIKTRLMTQGTSMKYKGIVDCIMKTSAEEGTRALFKGMAPRVIWIGIGGSIFFGVLERTKKLMAAMSST